MMLLFLAASPEPREPAEGTAMGASLAHSCAWPMHLSLSRCKAVRLDLIFSHVPSCLTLPFLDSFFSV